jgi:DNA-directed RNA polymerase subunit H (RpoH/RPB5)
MIPFPPIVIINKILTIFFPYRGFKVIGTVPTTDDDIISNMEKIGYITINAINTKNPRGLRDRIIMVIIKNNDNLEIKKIEKIIEEAENSVSKNKLDELFIICNEEYFKKKNFIDFIIKQQKNQKDNINYENIDYPFYTICPYYIFAIDVPNSDQMDPHYVMSKNESQELLKKERLNNIYLPRIIHMDTAIIWNGGRVGEYVKIYRKSESAMSSIYYRKIIYGISFQ